MIPILSYKKHRHPELVSGSIGRFTLTKRGQTQPNRKIRPNRIPFVDQIDLPRPMPIFQLFLARNRTLHVAKHLKMHEAVNAIFGSKTGRRIVSMLPDARHKVGRHSNIQRAIKRAGKDIDARLLFFSHGRSLAAKWTLKQVQGDGNFWKGSFLKYPLSPSPRHPELVSGSIGRFALMLWGTAR